VETWTLSQAFGGRGGTTHVQVEGEPRAGEKELVERAVAGDVEAFEELYGLHVGRVYALCLRLTASAQRAEELTQDVFVRAWQKLRSFRGESAFFSWLYRVATNVVFSEARATARRRARIQATDDLSAFEGRGPQSRPDAGLDLEKAIASLPAGAREVFVLHDVEGFRHQEIGELLGVAAGTSKAQLHRARRLLREALGS
jgi:RNA polymerase sigma-70 factor (ECF subfamily)